MNAMQDSSERREEQGAGGGPAQPQQAPYAQPPQPMMQPAPAVLKDPRSKSPVCAAVLSLMPGLGQVYIGYYQRGFIHLLVIAGTISVLASADLGGVTPLFALFMAFFWLYNIIDAARRAALYNEALSGRTAFELPQDFKMPGLQGSILGGSILIIVGFGLLLNTRFGVSLAWVEEWWPVAPMLFGAYLLVRALQERRTTADSSD